MKKVIHKADTRGHSKYEWLDSYHTFSFDEYFDSNRINFGALRVLNDDKVAPGEGFQTHPHKNMEIVSIPLKGHLQHGDSKKNSRIITVGEIQTMSAGTGIFHSEMNASPVEPVEFLQIWIMPSFLKPGEIAVYDKKNNRLAIDAGDVALEKMWIQDEFFVSNKTLGEVCRILSKRYDVEIKVDDELEDKYRYTFTLRNETLEEIVRIMARINPIAYHFDDNNVLVINQKWENKEGKGKK